MSVSESKSNLSDTVNADVGSDQNVTSYSILDHALWTRFNSAKDAGGFLSAWIALQGRQIGGQVSGIVMLGDPDTGPFSPVALLPENSVPEKLLIASAEKAFGQRMPIVLGEQSPTGPRAVAQPILHNERLFGAIAFQTESREVATAEIFRRIHWGAAWIEVLLSREQEKVDAEMRERATVAFDMLATVLEQDRFDEACTALVTDLAQRFDCDPVSIGFRKGRQAKVAAISHASGLGRKMRLVRDVGGAMDEAIDQNAVILYPQPDHWEFRVTRAHTVLAESHGSCSALTVPLQSRGEIIGALTFERRRSHDFDESEVEVLDAVAGLIGPVIDDRRENGRLLIVKVFRSFATQLRHLLGPAYFGRKLATVIAVGIVGFFSIATGAFSVTAPAVVQGTVQRTIVAPFNGYLASQHSRAGDVVSEDQLLAVIDDKDLVLERLRLWTSRDQRRTEYDQALAKRELAEASIILNQISQVDAQIQLVDEQLARTRITAAFDGIVVSGDLSQAVGASLERGQILFEIAPLDEYRIVIQVDETDVHEIMIGQEGILRVSAIPEAAISFSVARITPLSTQKDGRNYFEVEGQLFGDINYLRPGMQGVTRISVDERLLINIWTDKLVDWLRLALWRWTP